MNEMIQPVLAVTLVLGLLGGALYLLRKRGVVFSAAALPFSRQVPTPRQLKVIERISLGPHHALHLIRVGDRVLLVATAPGSCQLMDSPKGQGATL